MGCGSSKARLLSCLLPSNVLSTVTTQAPIEKANKSSSLEIQTGAVAKSEIKPEPKPSPSKHVETNAQNQSISAAGAEGRKKGESFEVVLAGPSTSTSGSGTLAPLRVPKVNTYSWFCFNALLGS